MGKLNDSNQLARQSFEQGNFSQAEKLFRQALRQTPESVALKINLAASLVKLCRYRESLDVLNEVIAVDPNNSLALHNIGLAYQDMGDLDTAIIYYKRVLAINPSAIRTKKNLGKALTNLNFLTEALATYEGVLIDEPTSFDARLEVAGLHLLLGCWNQSIDEYLTLLARQFKDFKVFYGLSLAYLAQATAQKNSQDLYSAAKFIVLGVIIHPIKKEHFFLIKKWLDTLAIVLK